MNVYQLLKIYQRIKSPRIKLMGILALHVMRRRYLNVYLDPVMGCNIQCQMCYFSIEEKRKELHARFSEDDLEAIAKAIYHRALKLQIGCGAEPTLYKDLEKLVKRGKDAGIPYVSMTTNGNLLDEEKLRSLIKAGLNEITVSTHGLTRDTYEKLMKFGNYDKFLRLIAACKAVKADHPDFKIRINYTVNEDNVEELVQFQEVFKDVKPDVVQLRPIQRLGKTAYSNFSLRKIIEGYEQYIQPVVDYCHQKGIVCIYPTRENLLQLEQGSGEKPHNKLIDELPYFNFFPYSGWKENKLDPYKETFEEYSKRTRRTTFIVRSILGLHTKEREQNDKTKNLNYEVG